MYSVFVRITTAAAGTLNSEIYTERTWDDAVAIAKKALRDGWDGYTVHDAWVAFKIKR